MTDTKLVPHIIKINRPWKDSIQHLFPGWNHIIKATNGNTAGHNMCPLTPQNVCLPEKCSNTLGAKLKWGEGGKQGHWCSLHCPGLYRLILNIPQIETATYLFPSCSHRKSNQMIRKDNNCLWRVVWGRLYCFIPDCFQYAAKIFQEKFTHDAWALFSVAAIKHHQTTKEEKGFHGSQFWVTVCDG